MWVFSFPNPVNEYAARTVAGRRGGHVPGRCSPSGSTWILIPLAYGFWARVLTGPTLSPLGQLATRVVAPRLPGQPRLVAGPPKRFAQAMGRGLLRRRAGALVRLRSWARRRGWWWPCWPWPPSSSRPSAICLGCIAFGFLMRAGVIPDEVCAACADISPRVIRTALTQSAERHRAGSEAESVSPAGAARRPPETASSSAQAR